MGADRRRTRRRADRTGGRRPPLPPLRRQEPHRGRSQRRPGPQFPLGGHRHPGRRDRRGGALGGRRLCRVERPRQHAGGPRHARLLLARPHPPRRSALRALPRRLRRPFELGHGVPADRLERPWLRRLRHRCQPVAHPRLVPAGPGAGARGMAASGLRLGRDGGRAAVLERPPSCAAQPGGRSRFRARPVRHGGAGDQPPSGAEPLPLHARQRPGRDPRL